MRVFLFMVLCIFLWGTSVYAQSIEPPVTANAVTFETCLPPVMVPTPVPRQQTMSEMGIAFLKVVEQFRSVAYRDSGGGYSIGYGFQTWRGRRVTPNYPRRITEEQASAELRRQLEAYEDVVRIEFAGLPISQSVFDALVSVCYNLGHINTAILRKIRTGRPVCVSDFVTTAKALNRFSPPLYARRVREFSVFLGDYDMAVTMELESWSDMRVAYRAFLPRAIRVSSPSHMRKGF